MRSSFLVVVTALAVCMSVTACSPLFVDCKTDKDCCSGLRCNLKSVSMSCLLCIQDSTRCSCLAPCNVNSVPPVPNPAVIRLLIDGLAACPWAYLDIRC
ncbi:hypothetical protein F4604DRAFT_574789 [Suillus subluteus]|nr:hypothetical protein F4604DRAFT_574789 [Suillus subluteus]